MQANACAAGDSAAYERRASGTDDVVIVSALRTPITKVSYALMTVSHFSIVSFSQETSKFAQMRLLM